MPEDLLTNIYTFLSTSLVDVMINALGAIIIFAAGSWLSGSISRSTQRALERSTRIDATLRPLAVSLVRYAVIGVTLLAVLGRFGVETTSVVAIFGAAGLAIGLALQGTLSNVAAGVMLLILRPFKVGDVIVVGGNVGTVTQIGLFTTELNTPDNVFVSLPNSSVWNAPIVNHSRNDTRRFDLTVGIGYDDDIDKAIGLVEGILAADPNVLAEPPVTVAVRALGESSVDLVIRGYTKTADFWPTVFGVQRVIKLTFDAEGVSIPYPQRTLHVETGAVSLAAVKPPPASAMSGS